MMGLEGTQREPWVGRGPASYPRTQTEPRNSASSLCLLRVGKHQHRLINTCKVPHGYLRGRQEHPEAESAWPSPEALSEKRQRGLSGGLLDPSCFRGLHRESPARTGFLPWFRVTEGPWGRGL